MNTFQKDIWLLRCIEFGYAFIILHPILTLFLYQELGSATLVGMVFGVTSLATFLLEIPSGVLSDRIGKKLTINIALAGDLLSILLLFRASHVWEFMLYALILSISAAFSSGTFTAYLYDICKEAKKVNLYNKYQGQINTIRSLSVGVAALLGGYLATFSLRLPIIASALPLLLALFLSFFLSESKIAPTHSSTYTHLQSSLRDYVSRPRVLTISFIIITGIVFAGPIGDLRNIFYETRNVPLALYGVLASVGFILSAIGSFCSYAIVNRLGLKTTWVIGFSIPIFIIFIATIVQSQVAPWILLFTVLFYGVLYPIEDTMMNQAIDSHNRVTMLSIHNAVKSGLLFITVPLLGYLVDILGIDTAYQLFLLPLIGVTFMIWGMRRLTT